MKWLLLLTKIDDLNRRIKEPGWLYEDKQAVYSIKDSLMEYILRIRPEELTIELVLVPYYSYSQESKDRAGALMRSDPDRKPFEYYLAQVPIGRNDIEIPEKASIEVMITCAGQEFSFHQPLSWFVAHGWDTAQLNKKAWINANDFHHMYLEKIRNEIESLKNDLKISG